MYGRTQLEWEALEAAGWEFLVNRARTPRPATNYTEMNKELAARTGQPPWNFEYAKDRAAMGELLGRLVDRSYEETKDRPRGGLMISALVMFLGGNGVGRGFFSKAASLNLIPSERIPQEAKDKFWGHADERRTRVGRRTVSSPASIVRWRVRLMGRSAREATCGARFTPGTVGRWLSKTAGIPLSGRP